MKELTSLLGGIALLAIFTLYAAFVGGLILYKFYWWFLVPVFVNIPTITITQAMGMTFILTLFRSVTEEDIIIEGKKIKKKVNWPRVIVTPWILLLMGWFIHIVI